MQALYGSAKRGQECPRSDGDIEKRSPGRWLPDGMLMRDFYPAIRRSGIGWLYPNLLGRMSLPSARGGVICGAIEKGHKK
ncbi:hypothetical protein JXO59_01035 [candidate division KSB1 bacterium]|nr:hypothetical protein [candidate division KSB1 bacterium]